MAKKRPLGSEDPSTRHAFAHVAGIAAITCRHVIGRRASSSWPRLGIVYAIANQKGGVGKTTTAVNMAACVAATGRQTLLVDLDQQCNATVALGIERGREPLVVRLPDGPGLGRRGGAAGRSRQPLGRPREPRPRRAPRSSCRESRARRPACASGSARCASASHCTLLDCPPSLGPVTVNALVAADRVIVPVQAEYLALEGLVQFLDTLAMIRRELNPALVLSGVVITMHDERTRLAQDVERELRQHFPDLVFETVIPRSVRVAEAPSYGVPVIDHAPQSPGSAAYRELAQEVAERG